MIKMSQGNKKITTRKIPATNNKVLARTGNFLFFKKYRQLIIKFWSIPVPVRETVRIKNHLSYNGINQFLKHITNCVFDTENNKEYSEPCQISKMELFVKIVAVERR